MMTRRPSGDSSTLCRTATSASRSARRTSTARSKWRSAPAGSIAGAPEQALKEHGAKQHRIRTNLPRPQRHGSPDALVRLVAKPARKSTGLAAEPEDQRANHVDRAAADVRVVG